MAAEHELALTALFNEHLAGPANAILRMVGTAAENPAKPWTNWLVMEILTVALLMIAVALVRNKAIDRVRASQRRARLMESAGAEAELTVGVAGSANEHLHGQEKAGLIRSALVDLPAEQRHAIELAFFSGLTQDEISVRLSQPLGTIKARIRRGLLKLRDQLEGVL